MVSNKKEECELAVKAATIVLTEKCGTDQFIGVMEPGRRRKHKLSGISPCWDLIHGVMSYIFEQMGPVEYKAGYKHMESIHTELLVDRGISGGEDPLRRDGSECRVKTGWILVPEEETTGQPRDFIRLRLDDALKDIQKNINNEKDKITDRFFSYGFSYLDSKLINIKITKITIEDYGVIDGITGEAIEGTIINYSQNERINGMTIWLKLTVEAKYERHGY